MGYEEHARIAMGILGWSPDQFWSATVPEFIYALEGYNKQFEDPNDVPPLTRKELEEMMENCPDD